MDIRPDDLSHPSTRALLALHVAAMRAGSPPGASFALDLSGLLDPAVTVWTAWDGDVAIGVGALKTLTANQAEVKSMRTHPDWLRRGVAQQMLLFILAEAERRGVQVLSLETGCGAAFDPAVALYERHGFVRGDAFAGYVPNGFSQFFHRTI